MAKICKVWSSMQGVTYKISEHISTEIPFTSWARTTTRWACQISGPFASCQLENDSLYVHATKLPHSACSYVVSHLIRPKDFCRFCLLKLLLALSRCPPHMLLPNLKASFDRYSIESKTAATSS